MVFCTCDDYKDGWTKDPDTEYWIHAKPSCRRPSKYAWARECDGCGTKFLPAEPTDINSVYELLCEGCKL